MRAESEISQQHTIDLTVFLGVLTGTDPQFCTGGDDDELEWLHMSDWSNRDAGCGQGTNASVEKDHSSVNGAGKSH